MMCGIESFLSDLDTIVEILKYIQILAQRMIIVVKLY